MCQLILTISYIDEYCKYLFASEAATETEKMAENEVVEGTINRLGDYLVLITEDENYQVMDFGENVSTDGFSKGDDVVITYTGTLGDEEHPPIIVYMEAK